jgi:hypothetical protein
MSVYNFNSFPNGNTHDKTNVDYLTAWIQNEPATLESSYENVFLADYVSFALLTDANSVIIKFYHEKYAQEYLDFFLSAFLGNNRGTPTGRAVESLFTTDTQNSLKIKTLFVKYIVANRESGALGVRQSQTAGAANFAIVYAANGSEQKALIAEINNQIDAAFTSAGVTAPSNTTGLQSLLALETSGKTDELVAVIAPLVAGIEPDEESFLEEDLRNYLQCMLLHTFLNDKSYAYSNNISNTTNSGSMAAIPYYETSKNNSTPYDSRLTPLSSNQPSIFLNNCLFDRTLKTSFKRKSLHSTSKMPLTFYFVKPVGKIDSSTNKITYIEATKEVQLDFSKSPVQLTSTTITFDGTNPSTARKDVKVQLKFALKDISSIEHNIALQNNAYTYEFYKLITLPYGKVEPSSIGGSVIRGQYSPDYNRLRMKIAAEMVNDYTNNKALRGLGKVTRKNHFVLDLAIESHEISRSDEADKTTVTINYRGYHETLLNMPFMDSLVTSTEMDNRIAADAYLLNFSDKCSTDTIKEIIRINRLSDQRYASGSSWTGFMNKISNTQLGWVEYKADRKFLRTFAYTDSIDFFGRAVAGHSAKLNFDLGSKLVSTSADGLLTNLKAEQDNLKDKKVNTLADTDSNSSTKYTSSFTTLGSIMNACLDGLYDGPTRSKLKKEFEHTRLRFMVAPIEVRDPFSTNNSTIIFNPLELPIDILFFNQWFQATIVNKGLTYYPVMTMIRDLIERLVNSLLLEVCFSNSLPGETPLLLRTGFFSSNDDKVNPLLVPNKKYYTNLDTIVSNLSAGARLFNYDASLKEITQPNPANVLYHYCVIYPQARNSFISSGATKTFKNSPYIPIFAHGKNLKDSKNISDSPLSDVKFSKQNMPGLKEARFFSGPSSGLNILSNVYNLDFSLKSTMANMSIFPGQIIKFSLEDFDKYNSDWKNADSLSAILGYGGYYTVTKVTTTIEGTAGTSWTQNYSCLWSSNGSSVNFRRLRPSYVLIENDQTCKTIFDAAVTRYTGLGGNQGDVERSFDIIGTTTESGTRYYASQGGTQAAETEALSAENNIKTVVGGIVSNFSSYYNKEVGSTTSLTKPASMTVTVKSKTSTTVNVIIKDDTTGISAEYLIDASQSKLVR